MPTRRLGMDTASDIQSELIDRLLPDALAAVDALNAEGADDVYAVAIIANSGFFSGVGLVSNTVAHLSATQNRVNDSSLSPEYFQLSPAEWNRYEWDSFARTNEYLGQLEELYYEDELPFEDDSAFGRFMAAAVVDVFRRLDLRQRVASQHGPSLYLGLGYSDPAESERSLVLAVGEALNDEGWSERLRSVYGTPS